MFLSYFVASATVPFLFTKLKRICVSYTYKECVFVNYRHSLTLAVHQQTSKQWRIRRCQEILCYLDSCCNLPSNWGNQLALFDRVFACNQQDLIRQFLPVFFSTLYTNDFLHWFGRNWGNGEMVKTARYRPIKFVLNFAD